MAVAENEIRIISDCSCVLICLGTALFRLTRDEVRGKWRKIQNAELNNLFSSLNIIWVIKFRRLRHAGHVTHMEET
jgi:hypothetical protein